MYSFKKSSFVCMAACAVVTAGLSSSASAATFTWNGAHGSSNSWGSAGATGNWSGGAAPASASDNEIVFNTLTRPDTILGGAPRSAKLLTYGANITSAVSVTFGNGSGGAQTFTFDTDIAGGDATLFVDPSASGNVTLGNGVLASASIGNFTLLDNLVVDHRGTGRLTTTRAINAGGNTITKRGSGTWRVGAFSVDGDLDSASTLKLEAGTLEVFANFQNKNFDTVNVNVVSASKLDYNNSDLGNNYNLSFSGSASFALNADLSVGNISAHPTNNNAINISRSLTGSGDIIVGTLNNIASNAGNYSYQRLQLSGSNAGWSGDLVVAKGTAQFSGNTSHGTGAVIIGTTGDSFGAGLAFNQTSDVLFSRDITVRSGASGVGFRGIKSNNIAGGDVTTTNFTGYNMTLSGNIALEGDLSVDHSLINSSTFSPSPVVTSSHFVTLSGNISGLGGLNVTRVHIPALNAPDSSRSRLLLTGTNTYTGPTNVSSAAALIVDGSLTSNISINGGRFGGNGSTTGNLSMLAGSTFVFSPSSTFDVVGSVSLDNSFGVASLVNIDGTAVDWSLIGFGTYTLIDTTSSSFVNISNFGFANAALVASGSKFAYFKDGSLDLVIAPVPEPTTAAVFGCLALLVASRRKRD
jgi:hypothetical protein